MKLGILGGGQLARMLALAAYPLNIQCAFLDPAKDACAGPLGKFINAPYDDENGLNQLAQWADQIAFEFESVPASILKSLASQVPVFPGHKALLITQDRYEEKQFFQNLGVDTAAFVAVNTLDDLRKAVLSLGRPSILKSRRLGYDGKGQAFIDEHSDLAQAFESIGKVPSILEGYIKFDREVSIIAVRAENGDTKFYPLVENIHRHGILHTSFVLENDPQQQQAENMVRKLMDNLDYVGVIVLELFQVGDQLLANEYAPRVHNSGHWSIEGAVTSQFENHIRAVCGKPLGDTGMTVPSAMINIIGSLPDCNEVLKIPGAHLHLYNKQAREGRKLGHVTVCAKTDSLLRQHVDKIMPLARIIPPAAEKQD